MVEFAFSDEKNKWLKKHRNISFEEVMFFIENDLIEDIIDNPNQKKYNKEESYIIEINDYFYAIPFVDNGGERILKTIMKNRDINKIYQRRKYGKKEK